MISFIIKKATVIYRVSSLFLCLFISLFCSGAIAQSDINSYCFESDVALTSVERSVNFLLLPKDTVYLREEDHCIDIVTSPDRGKLFEKFLSGRYNLRREANPASFAEIETCQLVLKTTVKQKKESQTVKAGDKNTLSKSEDTMSSKSTIEMALGAGVPGEMTAGPERLKVTCRFFGGGKANLQFAFADKEKGGIATDITIAKGEWLNIGSILKDLNEKNKILGVPQAEVTTTTGKTETNYELQVK